MISLPSKLYTINIKEQRISGNQVYRKYFTSSLNDKQCIFSFKEHSVATDCTVFLAHYKNKFHEYPVIDNSNVLKVDSCKINEYFNNSIANILANEIEIVEDSGEEILSVCSLFGMGLIILEKFSFIQHSGSIDLMFSGEECNIEPNPYQTYNEKSLIDYLDSLIK
jgi:hypothetical protein